MCLSCGNGNKDANPFRRPYHNGSPVSRQNTVEKDGRESGSIFTEKFEVSISDEDCYDYC